MLNVNSIKRGIVIDHIKAGCGYKIFKHLGLHKADYSVALLKNVNSNKLGKKDIIKIENEIDIDLTVLGIIDPNITINIIEDEKIKDKINIKLPKKVKGVFKCKNPRCITTVENIKEVEFILVNDEKKEYKCEYCESRTSL
ncbi:MULTISPECIES: aspartate carbamoyltransferase regulatory subunit [Tepidibacter]|jgi:aspartate carbamoyltransferase regulatory subunit|uniref:Aspartate carbamoyltransferase regulatory subunit n=2 Tax=Tepidibacter TaxID=214904 RepID=A0A1M5SLU2_9FIRM|nr:MULTISPECIES: aspartate carbamoyltransferase regulatory subunit [Tepidibacter]SHH39380.1 aspartate carbamoyltransferase regulatory subunit [Tepidibacter thalassicus DSM 15285]SHK11143.1 aspartate carbamoyltransferase regulatory subunit [Tepidibacter formicigenes DSM 15518]